MKRMTMQRVIIGAVVASLLLAGCGTKPPDQMIKSRFPKQKDGSGVTYAMLSDNKLSVTLNFFPVAANNSKAAEKEIGILVGNAIKQAFDKSKELLSVTVSVNLPYNDAYGKTEWRYYCTFTVSATLYAKINWDNFDKSTLLQVAEVKYK